MRFCDRCCEAFGKNGKEVALIRYGLSSAYNGKR